MWCSTRCLLVLLVTDDCLELRSLFDRDYSYTEFHGSNLVEQLIIWQRVSFAYTGIAIFTDQLVCQVVATDTCLSFSLSQERWVNTWNKTGEKCFSEHKSLWTRVLVIWNVSFTSSSTAISRLITLLRFHSLSLCDCRGGFFWLLECGWNACTNFSDRLKQ